MSGPRRRAVLLACVAAFSAGCPGRQLTYDDAPPPPTDDTDDEFGESELENVVSFAAESTELLREAAGVLGTWEETPEEVEVEEIDELRIAATGMLTTYLDRVAPYEDDIAALEAGTTVNGESIEGNGGEVLEVLRAHEHMLDTLEEITIALLEADGDPNRVSDGLHNAIAQAREDIAILADRTETVLPLDA